MNKEFDINIIIDAKLKTKTGTISISSESFNRIWIEDKETRTYTDLYNMKIIHKKESITKYRFLVNIIGEIIEFLMEGFLVRNRKPIINLGNLKKALNKNNSKRAKKLKKELKIALNKIKV